ncbi:MAG TPA: hypothetical protein VHK63_04295 [Candidatus Limnocylindria bacterium]|nr:hypothetical protein [Candidatus Limnocylindria bacterium]
MSSDLAKQLEKEKQQIQKALDATIEDTIRQSWLPNTLAWLGVTLGGFVICLLLLVLVAGGG